MLKKFPKAPDEHKPGRPLVPNGLGVIYVIVSVIYLFIVHGLQTWTIEGWDKPSALTLASCILFGGFMGLLDDWMDIRWRYKALFPLIAAIPLVVIREGETTMSTYIFGKMDFGPAYYFIIVPLIVTITTNVVNQLGGLNGLETICPSIILTGLVITSIIHGRKESTLLYVPILILYLLAYYNFRGKIFVGNIGSFAFGVTLAAYAIIANIEQTLAISILPYIFNSALIIINIFFLKRRPKLTMNGLTLKASHKRSLVTLIAYYYPTTERRIVALIALLFTISTAAAVIVSIT
ncbi:MAG: hypothetical protein QXN24_01725 [Candidatus Bathyarchaeia archaeon]|nr:hypothetical protein [Candidatus Bathyarchaeota archaeon]